MHESVVNHIRKFQEFVRPSNTDWRGPSIIKFGSVAAGGSTAPQSLFLGVVIRGWLLHVIVVRSHWVRQRPPKSALDHGTYLLR